MNFRTRTLRSLTAAAAAASVLVSTFAITVPTVVMAASCSPSEQGSTTVFPAIDAARPTWQGLATSGNCTLALTANGSGAGLTALRGGLINFGASSRPLGTGTNATTNAAELAGLFAWRIGLDGLVFQVSDSAAMSFITQITPAQVQGIYNGTFQNWSDGGLGGPNTPILADCRITASGSRDDSVRLFGLTEAGCDTRLTTSADEANAAKTDFHIVYTSLANVGIAGTKELRLSGGAPLTSGVGSAGVFVAPSKATVSNGTYPAPRELFLAVQKFASLPAGQSNTNTTNVVKAYDFINYMASSAGQAFVSQVGFVPVAPFVPFPINDINLDGVVSLPDLGQITGKWAQTDPATPGWVRGDANRDGVISLPDIGAVTSKWGSTAAGTVFKAPAP
ncbi:MAG TPA: substrate-binding domain-containing protein [Candidatus Limnocylindrales bacterium]|nr:substrate-binding domain-containing protein [Candidatus Limnocylindrales bacterium]